MLRDAKVGDRVWGLNNGWGTITKVNNVDHEIFVDFDSTSVNNNWYYMDGTLGANDIQPTLFWDEVKIVPPPRPKKKVKKTHYYVLRKEYPHTPLMNWFNSPEEIKKCDPTLVEEYVIGTMTFEVEE